MFRQLLTESLVLAGIGGAIGVALAWVLLQAIVAADAAVHAAVRSRRALERAGHALHARDLAGLRRRSSAARPRGRRCAANTNETLKEGGRSIGGGRHRLRRALVVVEFALALTLLAGGGLAIHSLIKLANVDLGFQTRSSADVLAARSRRAA